jgi:hypothetical protein
MKCMGGATKRQCDSAEPGRRRLVEHGLAAEQLELRADGDAEDALVGAAAARRRQPLDLRYR